MSPLPNLKPVDESLQQRFTEALPECLAVYEKWRADKA
ncbi:hypothetical protein GPUN_1610 [Glaciecola punicea ACAM 611]|uniref:Uncharacterized protein n=1 Tax=Glaciecola punicea ACAM 611 TaxID=1121923 RepID=H5TBQ0_9ALTE|nr:hypothetical protein GPUN_1610 [Glaciecola punicea ACAM 611]